MVPTAMTTEEVSDPLPDVNQITLDHPWQWLAKGWEDLRRAPKFSISYGAFFVAVSYLLTLGLFNGSMFRPMLRSQSGILGVNVVATLASREY